jgi:hypothetical protein
MIGWAGEFMGAGAGAFIGSLWPVRSAAAQTFAAEFYGALVGERKTLGAASLKARQAIAADEGDPTWLAYTVYGNPSATVENHVDHLQPDPWLLGAAVKVTEDGVPVQDVIAAVKLAIKQANVSETDEGRDLRVASVRLVLHALAVRTVGGGLSFTVPFIGMPVRLGTKVTKSDTHEIEVNLTPPGEETGHEVREASLDVALVDAIETVRAVMASTAGGGDPFTLDDATITLSFAVTADGDISIGINGSITDEVTHTLALVLIPA